MLPAVGTSLPTIIFTDFIAARSRWRRGGVDLALPRGWGPWLTLGLVDAHCLSSL
jgi:uncharacterized protein